MNYTVPLYKNRVIDYSHGYGSLENSCLTRDYRAPTKPPTKHAGGQLMCGNLNCCRFSKSLNTYPAVFLAYGVQQADCSHLISLIAKYKLQWEAKLERDIRHPRRRLATGSLLASVSPRSLIPLPGQQQLWRWWTAGLGFICFHLAQRFVPISSTLGGYDNWSRDHNETPSITTINTAQLFPRSRSRRWRRISVRDLKEHEEAALL